MKTKVIFVLSVFFYLLYVSSTLSSDDPKSWKYFKINSNINSNKLFSDIHNELGIKEIESTFTLIINIKDTIPQNQYVDFIHHNTGAKKRYSWYELSELTQKALLDLAIPEKTNLDITEKNDKYFMVHANIAESPLFVNIQKELLKNEELLETYTLTVNVSDPDATNNYIVFGNENSRDPVKFAWLELSYQSREALLKWDKKISIEKQ